MSRPTSLVSGLLFVVVIFFTCCIQFSRCALGDSCTSDNCTSVTNSFCDVDTCQCDESYYNKSSSQCSPVDILKVTGLSLNSSTLDSVTVQWTEPEDASAVSEYEVTWSPAGTSGNSSVVTVGNKEKQITGLQSGMEYSITVKTKTTYKTQEVTTTALVITIKVLNESCTDTSECGTTNAECTSSFCKCKTGYYPLSTECKNIDILKVTGLSLNSSTLDSVTVQWTEPEDASAVSEYEVTWSPAGTSGNSSVVTVGNKEKQITGLQSGTEYSITVKTKTTYKTQEVTTTALVITIKVLNKSCTDTSECGTTNADCTSSFCKCKTGYYPLSTECKNIDILKVTGLSLNSSTLDSVTVQWTEPEDASAVSEYEVTWSPAGTSGNSSVVTVGNKEKQITGLQSGTEYSITVKTKTTYKTQEVTTTALVITIKVLNKSCTDTSECGTTNADCTSSFCKCKTGYYPLSTECKNIDKLKVTGLGLKSSTINSVTVKWTEPEDKSAMSKYEVTWSPVGTSGGSSVVTVGSKEKQITGLQSGTKYSITVKTKITYKTQEVTTNTLVITIKVLNELCTYSSECGTTNADCTSSYCKCKRGYYPLSTECKNIDNLKVTGLGLKSSTLNSVTVQWSEPTDISAVSEYEVTWSSAGTSGGSSVVTVGNKEKQITGLQSGTKYSITVKTKITYKTQEVTTTASVIAIKVLKESCTDTSECGTTNAECTSSFCKCKTGYYPLSTECKNIDNLKVTGLGLKSSTLNSVTVQWSEPTDISAVSEYEVTWSSAGTSGGSSVVTVGNKEKQITGLQSGTKYSITVKTKITYKTQEVTTTASVIAIKVLNESCTDTSECGTTNAECTSSFCKCKTGYYPLSTECKNIDNLKVTGLGLKSSTINSVTVNWTEPEDTSAVSEYEVTWSPADSSGGSSVVTVGSKEKQITGLQSGTEYSITVKTKITYKTQVVTTTASVITIPGTPGPYNDSMSNKTVPDITLYFGKSSGLVKHYTVTLTGVGDSNSYSDAQTVTPQYGDHLKVIFSRIMAGWFYNLEITAHSNGLSSAIYRYTDIRGSVTPPGSISQLTISNITHSSMKTTWKKPSNPNGDIFAYVEIVKLVQNGSCVQKIVFKCVDCGNNVTVDSDRKCNEVGQVTINKTKAELNNNADVFRYNITNLLPFTNYSVVVYAYNELDLGPETQLQKKTATTAAKSPTNLSYSTKTSSSITVTWTPEPIRPGITTYNLTIYEKSESESFKIYGSVQIKGWSTSSYLVGNLSSYWDYKFALFASTSAGKSQSVPSKNITTNQSAPIAVKEFSVSPISNNYTALTVSYKCPQQKDGRNGIIKSSNLKYAPTKASTDVITGDKTIPNMNCEFSFIVPVTAEVNYNFSVSLKTLYDGEVSSQIIVTKPGPPILHVDSTITKPSKPVLFENGFTMQVHPKRLYQPTTGKITLAGLIVYKEEVYKTAKRRKRQTNNEHYNSYINWYKANQQGFKVPYRATNDSWINKDSESADYQIGSMKCDKETDSFCNGPLPAGVKFTVVIFACTAGGCQESTGASFETKAVEGIQIGLIVGIVIAVAVILILVIVIIILIKKRRRNRPHTYEKETDEISLTDKKRPIIMDTFNDHITELHKDSNLLFSQEFEDLASISPKVPYIHSEMDGNRVKNRYVNILPFDHSRVKLLPLEEDPEGNGDVSDYINANYIPGYKGPREYIATQGPMTGTITDFWRMIWEQHSNLIVMLSDLMEKGKPKVDQYWPKVQNEPVNYGEITLELTNQSQLNKYTIRIFKLTLGKEERLVRQYFIPGWEDYSANLTPENVINFVQTIRKEIRPTDNGPIVVHCSAGVGRSGTFIALDVFQQWIEDHQLDDELDVFEFVLKMRQNRSYMVQTEKQYIFIHDTLKVMIQKRKLILNPPPEENIYVNKDMFDNKGFEPDEENLYQNVSSFKDPVTPTTVL